MAEWVLTIGVSSFPSILILIDLIENVKTAEPELP